MKTHDYKKSLSRLKLWVKMKKRMNGKVEPMIPVQMEELQLSISCANQKMIVKAVGANWDLAGGKGTRGFRLLNRIMSDGTLPAELVPWHHLTTMPNVGTRRGLRATPQPSLLKCWLCVLSETRIYFVLQVEEAQLSCQIKYCQLLGLRGVIKKYSLCLKIYYSKRFVATNPPQNILPHFKCTHHIVLPQYEAVLGVFFPKCLCVTASIS